MTLADDVAKWIKRSNKKSPRLIRSLVRPTGCTYVILYMDRGAARIGTVSDGLRCRYGIHCSASVNLYRHTIVGFRRALWQLSDIFLTDKDLDALEAYIADIDAFPPFDFNTLKDLKW